jgi:hypothetical protein
MGKEVSDVVVIEGILTKDTLGNLAIHPDKEDSVFKTTGYYADRNERGSYRELAEDAFFKRGLKPGDRIKYICVPQKP